MATERSIRLPGRGRTFVRDSGPRPGASAVVLLHGLGATAALNWPGASDALGRWHRVLEIDHRGHGRGIRSGRAFRLEDCADDVAALADALGIPSLIAVGYSMGGPIAMLARRRHPERVSGLVLCATAARFSREGATSSPIHPAVATGLRLTPPVVRRGVASSVVQYAGQRWEAPPALIEEVRRHDPAALVEAASAVLTFDATTWAADLRCPTASVVTTRDQLVPPRRQLELARQVGAVVRFVQADHYVAGRQPERFLPELVAACRSVAIRVDQRVAG